MTTKWFLKIVSLLKRTLNSVESEMKNRTAPIKVMTVALQGMDISWNSAMQFIENDITKALILVLAAVSTINAVFAISADRKKRKRQLAKEAAKKKAKKSR